MDDNSVMNLKEIMASREMWWNPREFVILISSFFLSFFFSSSEKNELL